MEIASLQTKQMGETIVFMTSKTKISQYTCIYRQTADIHEGYTQRQHYHRVHVYIDTEYLKSYILWT